MVIVDTFAHLDGDRNVSCSLDGALHNVAKQAALPRQSRSPTFSRHFRNRATKVQVDVVTAILIDEKPDCLRNGGGFHSIELNTPGSFGLVVLDQSHAGGCSLHQSPTGNHLADVETSAILATESAKSGVGNSGHGSQHNGDVKLQGADSERLLGESWPRHDYAPTSAADR